MSKSKELFPSDPRYREIQDEFDMEIGRKTPLAAMVFIVTSLVFFFFFQLEGWWDIANRLLCALMILLCVYRIRFCKKAVNGEIEFKKYQKMIYRNVVMTSVVWSIIFGLMTINVGYMNWRTVMMLAAFFALGGGVPWTMAYSRPLLIFLSVCWNATQIVIVIYKHFADNMPNNITISFIFYFIFFVSYMIRQGLNYRSQLFEKALNERELDKANKELLESRQKIIEQTAMTQQANRLSALGEMAGGVAHEINTPLAVIQMRTDNLLDLAKEGEAQSDRFKEEAKKIHLMVARIAKIIQNLRTFARDSADDPLQPSRVSTIIEDSLDLCREKFKNNEVDLSISELSDAIIDCVPFQISQVIINLLSNSFDAVKGTTRPWVKINSFVKKGNIARIEVIDSGSGIPDEIVQKIMQPFFTTKEVGQGTGLGLSVSKGIMDQHKGTLAYEKLNGFTCFAIELPVSKATEPAPPPTTKL